MCRSTKVLIVLAVIASVAVMAIPAMATNWNVSTDWSGSANPNGAWSYGNHIAFFGMQFTTYAAKYNWTATTDVWSTGPSNYGDGWTVKNISGVDQTNVGSMCDIKANQVVILASGPNPGNNWVRDGAIRWTAPSNYTRLKVHAGFINQRAAEPNAELFVKYRNGAIFRGLLSSTTSSAGCDVVLYGVKTGDVIDFQVRPVGAWNTYNYPMVGLDATITDSVSANTVTGTVTSGGSPVVGAHVYTRNATATATTDGSGNYTLSLAPGVYTIRAAQVGYKAVDQSVDCSSGSVSGKNFSLTASNWDLAEDLLMSGANPNGPWTYGFADGVNLYDVHDLAFSEATAIQRWCQSNDRGWEGVNATPYMTDAWDAVVEGFQATVYTSDYAWYVKPFYRWTSPVTGNIKIKAKFSGMDDRGFDCPVLILKNGTAIYSATVSGFAGRSTKGLADAYGTLPVATTENTVAVVNGDTIDFEISAREQKTVAVDANISMSVDGVIAGTVTSSAGGPIAGVTVSVDGQAGKTATTLADGTYSIGIAGGNYALTATKDGYSIAHRTGVGVTSGATTSGQDLTLTPNRITGTVTAVGGAPLAGVLVSLDGSSSVSAYTASDGTYALTIVPAGTQNLTAQKGSVVGHLTGVVVAAGSQIANQNFTLTVSYFSGTVTKSGGGAISGATVRTSDGIFSATTSSTGAYSLLVGPGTYTVQAVAHDYRLASQTSTVASGATNTLNFALNYGWDVSEQFSATGNPSGDWTYGYNGIKSSPAGFTPYDLTNMGNPLTVATWSAQTPNPAWRDNGGMLMCRGAVMKNALATAQDSEWASGSSVWPYGYFEAGQVILDAEKNWEDPFGQPAATWIAPYDIHGLVTVHAEFTGQYPVHLPFAGRGWGGGYETEMHGMNIANVAVNYNGVAQANGLINGFVGKVASGYSDSWGSTPKLAYDITLSSVKAGDVVQFVADRNLTRGQVDPLNTEGVTPFNPDDGYGIQETAPIGLVATITVAPPSGVTGRVTSDLGGNPPVVGATVIVSNSSNTVSYSTTTDTAGNYTVYSLAGTYNVEVQKPYVSGPPATGVVVASGNIVTRNFTLHHIGTWDYSTEFSGDFNPNGQWSYGWLEGGANDFRLYNAVSAGIVNYPNWYFDDGNPYDADFKGGIGKYMGDNPSLAYPTNPSFDYFWFEPSMGGMVNRGSGQACIRWTSPDARIIKLTARVTAQCPNQTPDASHNNEITSYGKFHIRKNGVDMYVDHVQGFVGKSINGSTDSIGPKPEMNFQTTLPVSAGDTIDLLQDWKYAWPYPLFGIWETFEVGTGDLVTTIPQIKGKADGTTVFLTVPMALICDTDNYTDGSFYIESDDRTMTLKCINDGTVPKVTPDYKIEFTGTVDTVAGQKVVRVKSINNTVPLTTQLRPVGATGKALAAAPMGANTNRLVKVWGKITSLVLNTDPVTNPYWKWEYALISDGSQTVKVPLHVTSYWIGEADATAGLAEGQYVAVTGIAVLSGTDTLVYPRTGYDFYNYTLNGR